MKKIKTFNIFKVVTILKRLVNTFLISKNLILLDKFYRLQFL